MMQVVQDITATDWQPTLDTHGEIVENLEDIAQCIGTILTTPKGEVPHRPEFGSDIWRFQDKPIPASGPKIRKAAIEALRLNERRLVVDDVLLSYREGAKGRLYLKVLWRRVGTNRLVETEVEL